MTSTRQKHFLACISKSPRASENLTGLAEEGAWRKERVAVEGVVVRDTLGGRVPAWGYQP